MTEALHDIARIGHAELLTPKADESLRFFVDVLGMEEEAREGQSVYLRGWGDYLRYSLKLTESSQAGLGHIALRAWSPEALERRVAAIEATGLGHVYSDGSGVTQDDVISIDRDAAARIETAYALGDAAR